MKVFLILTGLIVAVYSLDEQDRVNGENGWNLPADNGSISWIDLPEAEANLANAIVPEPNGANEPVYFFLNTRLNPLNAEELTSSTVQNSRFDSRKPTRFLIHGYVSSRDDIIITYMMKSWLAKENVNVISVDWPRAQNPDYYVAMRALPDVGKRVGEFIKTLNQDNGMSLDTLHVIGHSLGAHIAGYAAKTVGAGKIANVVGLDPALPLFRFDRPEERLSSTDGKFVEVLHTNGDNFGFLKPIGQRDFYVNGGKKQPACTLIPNAKCSHNIVTKYYGDIVKLGFFTASKCTTYQNAIDKRCGLRFNKFVLGVNNNPNLAEGTFYAPIIA